jgi:hypothetical protein
MSRLQDDAKSILVPLIRGEWPRLQDNQAAGLAAWVTMLVMVNEFTDPKTVATSAKQRRAFQRERTPPDTWFIWIGRYEDTSRIGNGDWNHHKVRTLLLPSPSDVRLTDYIDVHTSTFTVGKVFFHVFGGTAYIMFNDIANFSARYDVRRLWPRESIPLLAPPRVFNFRAFQTLSNDFARLRGIPYFERR